MDEEAGFIDAILANPSEDATRLVYADWLEERGDPRAAYLRLECQLARITRRLGQLGERVDPAWRARSQRVAGGTPVRAASDRV
jgi:uncharacterized protein (TIGR02996 family)